MILDDPQYPCERKIDFENGAVWLDGMITFKKGVKLELPQLRDMVSRIIMFEERYSASRDAYMTTQAAIAAVNSTPMPVRTIEELFGEE